MVSDDSVEPGSDASPPARKPSPKQKKKASPKRNLIQINLIKGEEEYEEEFEQQRKKLAKERGTAVSRSDFGKHLLFPVLYPEDRPHIPTVQARLNDLKAAADEITARIRLLEDQNKKLRNTIAESVGILLMKTAHFSRDEVKQWMEKRLGDHGPDQGDTGS